jgi:hypothetical protein
LKKFAELHKTDLAVKQNSAKLQNFADLINKNGQLSTKLQKLQNFAEMHKKITKSGDRLILQISTIQKFSNGNKYGGPKVPKL